MENLSVGKGYVILMNIQTFNLFYEYFGINGQLSYKLILD